ncbi:MAG: hypothetical protein GEV10_30265 [Streptosporangiales bacterium]|nr:hypothetical protein [Streptosporangiales bacterium]
MGYLVGIDAGGTFTDCVAVRADGRDVRTAKVQTTKYDLATAFARALESIAGDLDQSLEEFLADCELIIYSSTQETNALIERRGARVGLITTHGFEDTLWIQRAKGSVDGLTEKDFKRQGRKVKPLPLVDPEMVVGVQERVDCFGNVQLPLHDDKVRGAVDTLVDRGAEIFVVALLQSIRNKSHEERIREIVREKYPAHRLGAVPVVLSSEVSPAYREYPRFNTTVMAAYLQTGVSDTLKNFQEYLLDRTERPLLVMQSYGGASKITRSDAVSCLHSGPVAGAANGVLTHSALTERFGTDSAIFTDVGGTSFDVALLVDGTLRTDFEPDIERLRIQTPRVRINSIGAGGGTIAKIDSITGRLDVGPESAGAMPGPACYGLGGEQPTVTDADVVLGRINPTYFLGGSVRLYPELAERAIETEIAKPLGMTVEEAALAIVRLLDVKMSDLVEKEVVLTGRDPRDFVLYSYGGAGPSHVCGFADRLKPRGVVVPNRPSVFSAYGAATSAIRHKYWQAVHFELWDPDGGYAENFDAINAVCEGLAAKARSDLAAEGVPDNRVELEFEFEMKYGPMLWEHRTRVPVSRVDATSAATVKDAFTTSFVQEFGEAAKYESGGIVVEGVILTAVGRLVDVAAERSATDVSDQQAKVTERRRVVFDRTGPTDTAIYRIEELPSIALVEGPAVIEAKDTTYLVPPGWSATFDEDGTAYLVKAGE